MVRDPFYTDIIERLDGRLDPELFERCAADLLRDEWPTLVPVRGGTDAGMDGAIADGEAPAFPLVCTTAQDVIGNLTRSLDSYLLDEGSRRHVVLGTSQSLTPRRRRNLVKRAEEKGFTLVQVYDQDGMADRLYRSPSWCRELLNLTGAPSALSAVPLTRRPMLGEVLIGRKDDLAWLRVADGDRLLVGVPGVGKTFVLRKLALEGWGLFVASSDLTEIAAALRAQQPRVVIVDDAHLKPELLVELRRLREETAADFYIAATAWSGESDEIVESLNLTEAEIRKLKLLTRDEIAEVIHNSGVRGPVELVREIVDQAEGRPGLAVTLAYLCLRGGVREVALGEVLKRSTVTAFEKLIGEETTQILAALAVGGDAGMRPSVVASALEMPRYKMHSAVARLAAGGVVDEVQIAMLWPPVGGAAGSTEEGRLAVRPPRLRYALVRDAFFGGPLSLPLEELIEAAPEVAEVARTLVRTAAFGAMVPPDLLTSLLERAGSDDAWAEYTALGEAEAIWVLTNRPKLVPAIADVALERAPRAAIPRLLELAVGDERPTSPFPDHPIRRLEGWIQVAMPGTEQAVARRELMVEAVAAWIAKGGDKEVGVRALRMAMSPTFSNYTIDPGAGMTATFREGLLLPDELSSLRKLWPRVVELVAPLDSVPWRYLLEVVHDWAYPGLHILGRKSPEEVSADMRAFAERMLADMVRISEEHPGILHKAAKLTDELGWDLEVVLNADFEILFPMESLGRNWLTSQTRQTSAVRDLAAEWSVLDSADVAERLARLEAAAKDVDKNYPRHTPLLCEEIAERAEHPMDWLQALLGNDVPPDLLAPFLRRAAASGVEGWEEAARECLEDPELEHAAISVVITTPAPPPDLLSAALKRLERFWNLVEVSCLRGEVPEETLARLLRHEDPKIATAAAVGEWYAGPKGGVRDSLLADWRVAVLNAPVDEHSVGEILQHDPELACDWLRRREEEEKIFSMAYLEHAVESALSVLNREQRLSILRSVDPDSRHDLLVAAIVGDDLDLYAEFLKDDELTAVHLWPLVGRPIGTWSEKAKLALAAGFSVPQVAGAAYLSAKGWTGSESAMWNEWAEQFAELRSHGDKGVRSVAECGIKYAQRSRQQAVEEERLEAIYGPGNLPYRGLQ